MEFSPVSIVVSIKNEIENLPQLLKFLNKQDYPGFEVIIVDDFSTDGSSEFLMDKPGIRVIKPDNDLPGKKHGLEKGISIASFENILVTDGDCEGVSSEWVRTMIEAKSEAQIVLGYAPLLYKSIVGFFAAFETWIIAIQYLSYAKAGIPYMGVGRNMLFDKKLFEKNKGYEGHKDLASGDDDLLIRDIATGSNVSITLNPNSQIFSQAPSSSSTFLRQKKRHLSTSVRYKMKHQLLLSIWAISQMFFYLLIALYGCLSLDWRIVGTIWIVKIVIQWVIAIFVGIKMKETRFLALFPILDLLLAIHYWMMVPFTFIKNKYDWN
jgi:glycosyltransferase involved in cell wall biosynthesis